MTSDPPVFLVGSERSGTTLLRLLLSHHPQLAFHYESEFMMHPLEGGEPLPVGAELRAFQDWLREDRTFLSSGFVIDESLSYVELLNSFLRQKHMLTGKPVVGMTVHKSFEHLPRVWPEARYIHLLRDGRNVTYSSVQMGWYGNAWAATERWKAAMQSYARLRQQVPAERVLEVRFESLLEDVAAEITRICEFLKLPYSDDVFAFEGASSYSAPKQGLASDWRTKLTEKEIQQVESELGELLQEHGYPLSELEPISLDAAERARLAQDNVRRRRAQRVARYGWCLLLLERFVRVTRLAPLRDYVRARMASVDRDLLK